MILQGSKTRVGRGGRCNFMTYIIFLFFFITFQFVQNKYIYKDTSFKIKITDERNKNDINHPWLVQ